MADLSDKNLEPDHGELRKKLDARGRRRLAQGESSGSVEFLLRTESNLTAEQREQLSGAGCQVHFETGNVLSAAGAVEHLPEIAALDFVRRIELSRSMFQERPASLRRKP